MCDIFDDGDFWIDIFHTIWNNTPMGGIYCFGNPDDVHDRIYIEVVISRISTGTCSFFLSGGKRAYEEVVYVYPTRFTVKTKGWKPFAISATFDAAASYTTGTKFYDFKRPRLNRNQINRFEENVAICKLHGWSRTTS